MKTQSVNLSDIAEINPRLAPNIARDLSREVDFVPMACLSEDGHVKSGGSRRLSEVNKGYTCFANGDVIIAKITPCMENGKAAYVENLRSGIGFGSTEFHVLRPKAGVIGRYLFYMVWNEFFRREAAVNMTGSAGQKRVPAKFFGRFKIPLPTLTEQKRIVAILDNANSYRQKRQQVNLAATDLPHSLFLAHFGSPSGNPYNWPMRPFPEVCDSRLGKMLDGKQQTGKHPRPYLRNLNVQWGRLDLSTVFEMDFDEDDRREFRLQPGDVLICEGGAGVGQTAIWRGELPECYFQKSLHRVRPIRDRAIPDYISHLIWMLMRSGSLMGSISSATIPHLTGVRLKSLEIPVPTIEIQQQFARELEAHRSLVSHSKQTYDEAAEMFNSLSQLAFRGNLI